ncbi:putative bifunctional diguanylate cyclase/phosphodiesterase [Achromobacter denitrificans]|uniref:putative bifunctional diguanylate cyclase/phosphodiesterase n=1 Tax=Achromobacter denitrificans TaxID=32002 RepID=UPI00240CF90E|nr:EAL domain-containing protein [Achromobacter denitrificans]MBV2160089.1 EAL domain-containing protein [Achromobacter denitrificans]MDX3877123.1 EAL domain-containing protein [Achromobacter sp.]
MIHSKQEVRLWAILEHLPIQVAWLDPRLQCKYANLPFGNEVGLPPEALTGVQVMDALPLEWQEALAPAVADALRGNRAQRDFATTNADGSVSHKRATVLPQARGAGGAGGAEWDALILVSDHTESARMRQKLHSSVNALADLKVALDAHAIVAVTDARGVITSVNDKFCSISQYDRGELIGKTHRVVNSRTHGPEFFRHLWRVISSGDIWTGEICNRAKDGSLYWVQTTIVPFLDAAGKPVQYISLRVDVTQRKLLEEDSVRRAFFDDLTGLPNRSLMKRRLREMKRVCAESGAYGALMFLDLDNFKEVNDTLGHESGDELLKQVSGRLSALMREDDTVARAGGDEYVIIVGDLGRDEVAAAEKAHAMTERIRRELNRPYDIQQVEVHSSPSIGVVLFHGESESDGEILKHADMALYRSKVQGKNQASLFDLDLRDSILRRASTLADLRAAIAREQFRLYYQPVVDARRRVIGYEALIRWRHPQRGVVMPNQFIGLAEQTGLIVEIGEWVIRQACRQLRAWSGEAETAQWSLSVNVSARQIRDPGFPAKVRRHVEASGIDPKLLRLELTESMFHTRPEQLVEVMIQLKRIGIRFSMDDFGTGYSSLACLKDMPFDQLKIDRAFVTDLMTHPRGKAIARTILDLACALELHVVAEGVDSMEQFHFLQEHGCQAFQGYLFGKPEPLSDEAGNAA